MNLHLSRTLLRTLSLAAISLPVAASAEVLDDSLFINGSLDVSGTTAVEELSASHVLSASAQGDSAFYGRQLGDTFTNSQPIFQAVSDHPNGLANWFFRGTIGGPEGTETFSIRADGQITSANLAGSGTSPLGVNADGTLTRLSSFTTGAGNVGLGTSTPNQQLEIGSNGGIGFSGPTLNSLDKKLYSPADGDLEWMTNNYANRHGFGISNQGSKLVYLNTAGDSYFNGGNVGIGKIDPQAKLDVCSDGLSGAVNPASNNFTAIFRNGTPDDSGYAGISMRGYNSNGFPYAASITASSGSQYRSNLDLTNVADEFGQGQIRFNTQSAVDAVTRTQMVIDYNGNVGIGTTIPTAKLEVAGDIKTEIAPDYPVGIQVGAEGHERPRIGFHVSDNSRRFKLELNDINTPNERLGIFSLNGGAWAETEVFTVNKGGNVGIGTISPTAKLDVVGDAKVSGALTVAGASVLTTTSTSVVQTTAIQTLTNKTLQSVSLAGTTTTSGNVGIQTTTPQGALTIGAGQLTAPVGSATAPSYTFNSNLNTGLYSSGTNSVSIATNGIERFRVYGTGNFASDDFANLPGVVGNGSYKSFHLASPTVKGSTMISMASRNFSTAFLGDRMGDFIIGNEGARPIIFKNGMIYNNSDTLNTGTEQMRIDGNGNVGIGTASPTAKLQVAGNVNVQSDLTASHVISNSSQGNSAFVGTQLGTGFINPQAIYTANTENPTPGSLNYFFKGVKAGTQTVAIDSDGSATFGKGGAAIRSWTVPVTADGPVALTSGTNRWNGIYILNWEGPNRSHNIVFAATGQQFEGANITVLSERAYNGAPVLTDLRIMQSADGANQQLVVTIANRNGGVGNATVSYYGSEPNVSFPRDQAIYPNRVSIVSNLAGSGPISTGNVGIGDTASALSPAWKSAEVIGQSGFDKVVIGPLASTYTGATIGAHSTALNAWADLNVAGSQLVFRTDGETEAARMTTGGVYGAFDVSRQIVIEQKKFGGPAGLLIKGMAPSYNWPVIGFSTQTWAGDDVVGAQIVSQIMNNAPGAEAMDLYFTTASMGNPIERLRITAGGNVGIGTSTPAAKLEVVGDVKTEIAPGYKVGVQVGAEGAERPRIGFHVSDDSRRFKIEVNDINSPSERLGFFSLNGGAWAETEVFTVNKGGNVGIGTISPAAKLDVVGNAKVSGTLTVGGTPVLTTTGNGAGLTGLNAAQLTTGTVPTTALPASVVQTTTAQTLSNKTLQNVSLTGTTTTSGNVGIQTTTPQSALTLGSGQLTVPAGSSAAPSYTFNDNLNTGLYSSGTNSVSFATNGIERFRVYSTGNFASDDFANLPGVVGNGTYKSFHLASPGVKGSTMISMASRNFSTAFLGDRMGDFIIGNEGARPIIFKNGMVYKNSDTLNTGTEQMRIDASGNVGLGTTVPAEKLDVTGNAKVSGTVSAAAVTTTTLTVNTVTVKAVLRIPPAGDLSMGSFASGTNPAN